MSIPKGYKLVPVEPTREILEELTNGNPDQYRVMKLRWGQMLATAPQPIYDEAKERELFESYATTHYRLQELPLEFDDGEYLEPEVQYSWESWEARAKAGEVGHE